MNANFRQDQGNFGDYTLAVLTTLAVMAVPVLTLMASF